MSGGAQIAIDWTPPTARQLARVTDPSSSHQAALEHLRSGKLTRHELLVYGEACRLEGQTYREIHAALAGAIGEPVEVMRRLCDLAPLEAGTGLELEGGLLKRGPKRRCGVSGKVGVTWWKPDTLAARAAADLEAQRREGST